jgi:uncharacterized membrane protein
LGVVGGGVVVVLVIYSLIYLLMLFIFCWFVAIHLSIFLQQKKAKLKQRSKAHTPQKEKQIHDVLVQRVALPIG